MRYRLSVRLSHDGIPIEADHIKKSFYVDDLFTGADSEAELQRITALLTQCHLPLPKCSNAWQVNEARMRNKMDTSNPLGIWWGRYSSNVHCSSEMNNSTPRPNQPHLHRQRSKLRRCTKYLEGYLQNQRMGSINTANRLAISTTAESGLHEAAVKSVKHHIKRTIGTTNLTIEEWFTLIAKVET